jgi:hypothetical protein
MDQWILIDSDRIGSVALWMRREGLTLGCFESASSPQTLGDACLYEVGEQVPKAPSRIAESHPVIVIANAASVLQHGIEDGTTTENSALGKCTSSAVQIRLRYCLKVPVQRATDTLSRKEWYLNPRLVIVGWASFEQEDVGRRILGKTIRNCESTWTTSDDYLGQPLSSEFFK